MFIVYLLTGLRSSELWQSDIIEVDNILAFNVLHNMYTNLIYYIKY